MSGIPSGWAHVQQADVDFIVAEVLAEIVRNDENSDAHSREDLLADVARRLEFLLGDDDEDEDHPEHIDCALGCRLDMSHGGACRERRGGEPICDENNHEEPAEQDDLVGVTEHVDKAGGQVWYGASCEEHGDLMNGDWHDAVTAQRAVDEHRVAAHAEEPYDHSRAKEDDRNAYAEAFAKALDSEEGRAHLQRLLDTPVTEHDTLGTPDSNTLEP